VEAQWAAERRGRERFVCEQPPYSILVRGIEADVLPVCEQYGMGVIPWSPLAGGWLSGKYRSAGDYPKGSRMTLRPEPYAHLVSDRVFKSLATFGGEARSRGVDITALAIAWVLHQPRVDAAIIGPRTPAQLDAALSASSIVLSDADADSLAGLF